MSYDRSNEVPQKKQISTGKKSRTRGKYFFLCKTHYEAVGAWSWNESLCKNCKDCIIYKYREDFRNGSLPLGFEVMEWLLTERERNNGKHVNNIANCSISLVLQWIFCNVYPQTPPYVERRIKKEIDEPFQKLKKVASRKKITDDHWTKYATFLESQRNIFDIKCCASRKAAQEKLWDCTMTERDEDFYKNQCLTPQKDFCTSYVERKWAIAQKRKLKAAQSMEARKAEAKRYEESLKQSTSKHEEEGEEDSGETDCEVDADYSMESAPKEKYDFKEVIDHKDDPLPYEFRHIRDGLRSVKPKYYRLIHKFKSRYHMSEKQAQAAVIETINDLTDREKYGGEWKIYDCE